MVYGDNPTVEENIALENTGNDYIKSYVVTEAGKLDTQMGASTTAIYYDRTMNITGLNKAGYTVTYLVRAYVKNEEGNVTYSDVMSYSINDIATQLYDNDLMSTYNRHNALYDNILKKVDAEYKEVDYDFQNTMSDQK